MQHVEAVLDVVAPFLLGMNVSRPALAVRSPMLLLMEFIANSARTGTATATTGFSKPGCIANWRHRCVAVKH